MTRCKYLFAGIFIFIAVSLSCYTYAQDGIYSVEIKNPDCFFCKNGEITITINNIDTKKETIVFLYKGNPYKKGKEIDYQKINSKNNSAIFTNLRKGEYYFSFAHKNGSQSQIIVEKVILEKE